jgi:hypothetical protein
MPSTHEARRLLLAPTSAVEADLGVCTWVCTPDAPLVKRDAWRRGEGSGRVSGNAAGLDDLSLNAKLRLPLDQGLEFQILLDRQQLPLAALEGPMDALRAYFAEVAPTGPSLPDLLRLRWKPSRPAALTARAPRNPSALHGALSLAPGLTSFVAIGTSLLDVRVSLRPDANLQLCRPWPGLPLGLRWPRPLP